MSPPKPKLCVLVVEDDPFIITLAQTLFEELDYEVVAVSNGSEALSKLDHRHFDLVFTDVIMPPGITGLELANQIRERWPHMPVLLTTGSEDVRDSGFPVLPKPYTFADLKEKLNEEKCKAYRKAS